MSKHLHLFGLELWRYRPIKDSVRIHTESWPWCDKADARVIYINKVFVRVAGWVYAVAWKSPYRRFVA